MILAEIMPRHNVSTKLSPDTALYLNVLTGDWRLAEGYE